MPYDAFWLRYLQAHAHPATRLLHCTGTLLGVGCLIIAAIALDWRWAIAAPLIGYGFAWIAHGMVEHNRPETF